MSAPTDENQTGEDRPGPSKAESQSDASSLSAPAAIAAPATEPASSKGARAHFSSLMARLKSDRSAKIIAWVTHLALILVVGTYVGFWGQAHQGMLFNPDLQTDDARTVLFSFHRYGAAQSLDGDPIADEMLSAVPWGVRILYMALAPIVDIYVAAKIVQGIALGLVLWGVVVLARSRRTGVASAALLVFLTLHTWFVVDRIGGGLPRSFGFPCFALWVSGVLAQKRVPRFASPIILAFTYPSVMNLILAAEGILALRGVGRVAVGVLLRRLRRYGVLVAVCVVCVLPATLGDESRGPIHTLEQAKKEPAFGRSGRLWILPFAKPVDAMTKDFVDPLMQEGKQILDVKVIKDEGEMFAVLLLCLFLLLPVLRVAPAPHFAGAFFVGTTIIYALSRILAFQLYSPERYYSFGMRMACIALLMGSAAHLWFWLSPKWRSSARNLTVALLISTFLLVSGDGLGRNGAMTIQRATDKDLYDFVRTLPKDVRFATHTLDGDGIPFWGARATTGSFETLQPWFVNSWARQKKRAEDTLAALYSTDREEVLRFAQREKVTHFLLNKGRYGKHLARKAGSFEPFTTYARTLLRNRKAEDVVLNSPPASAVEFENRRFLVVSVSELKAAWARAEKPDG